jgi:RNA recognition motif-containing protein
MTLLRGFGNATEMKLPMDKESGLPRGFAFVTFPTPEAGLCPSRGEQ